MQLFVLLCIVLFVIVETFWNITSICQFSDKTTKKETINAKIYNLELKYTIRRKKQALGWRKNLLEALLEKDEKETIDDLPNEGKKYL